MEKDCGFQEEGADGFRFAIALLLLGVIVGFLVYEVSDAYDRKREIAMFSAVCPDGNPDAVTQRYDAENFRKWLDRNGIVINPENRGDVCSRYLNRNAVNGVEFFNNPKNPDAGVSEAMDHFNRRK